MKLGLLYFAIFGTIVATMPLSETVNLLERRQNELSNAIDACEGKKTGDSCEIGVCNE